MKGPSYYDNYRLSYIADCEFRWNRAVENVIIYLSHECLNVRRLSRMLMTSMDYHWLLSPAFTDYPYVGSLISRMEFVAFFVGHEVLDDGSPGIGYLDPSSPGGIKQCLRSTGAMPFFHSNVHELRKFDPEAEAVTVQNAIEVLEVYERKAKARALKSLPEDSPFRSYFLRHQIGLSKARESLELSVFVEELLLKFDSEKAMNKSETYYPLSRSCT